MAGFDFHFPKHATGEALQRDLLRLMQREAGDLGLRFRFRSEGGELWGVLDGPLSLMYALRAYLGEDFPTHAAAATLPPDRRLRLRISRGVLREFDKGLWEMTDAIHNEIVPMMRDAGFEDVVPNSIVFDFGTQSHLARHLRGLTRTLILYIQRRVAVHTTVEEVHTVIELLLRTLLGSRTAGELTFAGMVDRATTLGHLAAAEAESVKRLKDVRREAKHRGQQSAEADRLVWASVTAIQKLLVPIRAR